MHLTPTDGSRALGPVFSPAHSNGNVATVDSTVFSRQIDPRRHAEAKVGNYGADGKPVVVIELDPRMSFMGPGNDNNSNNNGNMTDQRGISTRVSRLHMRSRLAANAKPFVPQSVPSQATPATHPARDRVVAHGSAAMATALATAHGSVAMAADLAKWHATHTVPDRVVAHGSVAMATALATARGSAAMAADLAKWDHQSFAIDHSANPGLAERSIDSMVALGTQHSFPLARNYQRDRHILHSDATYLNHQSVVATCEAKTQSAGPRPIKYDDTALSEPGVMVSDWQALAVVGSERGLTGANFGSPMSLRSGDASLFPTPMSPLHLPAKPFAALPTKRVAAKYELAHVAAADRSAAQPERF